MTLLEQSVLATFTWFDGLQHPLTTYECWQYLFRIQVDQPSASLFEVDQTLAGLERRGLVLQARGFWQLASSPKWLAIRARRGRVSLGKLKRARQAAKLISWVPFVRMVGVGNTVALGVPEAESDVDFLVIVKPGRLFLTRLLVTLLLQVRGWRRHGNLIAHRICLSFYLSTAAYNLAPLAYEDDPYLAIWCVSLLPLAGEIAYQDFCAANTWITRSLLKPFREPHLVGAISNASVRELPRRQTKIVEWALGGWLGYICEQLAKVYQEHRIRVNRASRLGDGGTAVVVSDTVLKFHESDRRPEWAREFRERFAHVLESAYAKGH